MRPKVICLLVVVLSLVGSFSGVTATAEESTDAQDDTTPPSVDAEVKEGELLASKRLEVGILDGDAQLSEVGDMMKDPYRPSSVDTDDDKEKTVDSDTVPVVDSHVVSGNKTHESDAMLPSPDQPVPVPESESASSSSPSSSTGLPEVSGGSQDQATATAASSERFSAASGEPEGLSMSPSQEGPTLSAAGESTTGQSNPVISTGLSSVSIISVSRSAMSPPTEVAAILSIVLVVSALVGYLGMLTWRRFLEKRYGNREMLVNEDDDLRHFEL